ncbi:MAG TPA: NAD(P)/FAD-dependent oxidoreductase [Gemmatimonadaceae bacterium]
MTSPDAQVLIVGGGPAGSTAAFFLARAGCDVLVVDRARFPRDKPCSEYLSPQASRLLQEMGVLDALESGPSARLTGMRVHAPDGTSFTGSFNAPTGYRAFRDYGLAIRRPLLDATLLARAEDAGARVRTGIDVRDLAFDGHGRVTGVVVREANKESTLQARVVIGADGLRSVVARRAKLGKHGRWPRRLALVRHYRGVTPDAAVGDMHVFEGGYAGFAPVSDELTNVAVVIPTRHAREIGNDRDAIMRQLLESQPGVAARLVSAEPATPTRAVGPFNWHAKRAWLPGAALVGDAADFFDPFTGEGMYAAMRGAELLTPYAFEAARADRTRAADIALAAYDRCRRHEFAGKWAVERAIAMAIASPSLINLAARALARRGDLADLLVGVTGDFVPARTVLTPQFALRLLAAALLPERKPVASRVPADFQVAGR